MAPTNSGRAERIHRPGGHEQRQHGGTGRREQDAGDAEGPREPTSPALIGEAADHRQAAQRGDGRHDRKDVEILLPGRQREESDDRADPAPEERLEPPTFATATGERPAAAERSSQHSDRATASTTGTNR